MIAARIARRELRGGLRGFRIFLACLALGVAAIAGIGTIRAAIQGGLEREGAALLGGQAQIELTYRRATATERAYLDSIARQVSEIVSFRSMAVVDRAPPERALTQIKAVDDLYPLVGSVQLDPPIPLDQALADFGAVVEKGLADRLALSVGDVFRLGTQDFTLTAILRSYPDSAGGSFALGPVTLVRTQALANSSLLGEGTLYSTQYRLTFDNPDLTALRTQTMAALPDSGLRWSDARDGAPGIREFVDRLGAFLVLVSLAGLAVGGVGVSSAVRAYLAGKSETIATLKTLGATRGVIFGAYFLQIGALTLVGLTLGVGLGVGVPLALAPLIEARLPVPAAFGIYARPIAEAVIYGVLAAVIFTLWPLARAEETRAAALFRDAGAAKRLPAARYLVAIAAALTALVAVAVWFSDTALLTLWTLGGIVFALALLVAAAWAVRHLARRLKPLTRGRPALRLALGAIDARGGETTSVVLSLGLGLSVLAAVGQIDGTLRGAIVTELPEVAPSYFFVDIQPSQIDGFRARLDDPGVSRVDAAPMLRGVITQINGRPATEVAGEHWVLEGDRGVTYSETRPDSTMLTAGEWWPKGYDGPPLVSFAADEAQEMGLALGDRLTVNILGRDFEATIASFRQVSFETAGIGFVMAMNPSALRGAPHSWIATVYATEDAEAAIVRDLTQAYPNITAIRVRDAIDRVAGLLGGIAAAIRWGAAAALITGGLVLIGAALAGEPARTREAAILKTVGATRRRVLRSFALRAGILGLAAGAVALAAGVAGGWAVSTFVMRTDYAVLWPSAVLIVAGGIGASLTAGLVFALRPLAAKPARVLRARE